MLAKVKCSNCGAEISNLRMSWGWKHLLIVVPILILGFIPLMRLTFFKGDVTKELAISEIKKRNAGDDLEIVGLITNTGGRTWSGITIEAEFFDASGEFLDEAQDYLQTDVAGDAKEHFKITISNPSPEILAEDTEMVVKVSAGHTMPF